MNISEFNNKLNILKNISVILGLDFDTPEIEINSGVDLIYKTHKICISTLKNYNSNKIARIHYRPSIFDNPVIIFDYTHPPIKGNFKSTHLDDDELFNIMLTTNILIKSEIFLELENYMNSIDDIVSIFIGLR